MFGNVNMSLVNMISLLLSEDRILCFKWGSHRWKWKNFFNIFKTVLSQNMKRATMFRQSQKAAE